MDAKADAISALIKALDDQDERVRRWSSEALGKIGAAAVPELCAAIEYDEGYNVHRFIGAAQALAEIGPAAASAIPGLVRGLRFVPASKDFAEEGATLRAVAAAALGEICADTSTSAKAS